MTFVPESSKTLSPIQMNWLDMVFQSKISISNPSVQSIFCCQEFCLHASNWTDGFFIPHGCKQFIKQMDQMKLFKSQSWNLKLDSINFVSKVDNVREIHEVRDTWCTGLKGRMHVWIRWIRWCCLSQKDLVQIWERFSLVHSKTHACKQSIEQMDQMGKFLKTEIMQTRFNWTDESHEVIPVWKQERK